MEKKIINKNTNLVLGDDPRRYRWKKYGKYEYCDQDSLGREPGRLKQMGIPEEKHYEIWFAVIPNGRKRKQIMVFCFDGNYKYTFFEGISNITKKELKEIEQSALNELVSMGLIKELRA